MKKYHLPRKKLSCRLDMNMLGKEAGERYEKVVRYLLSRTSPLILTRAFHERRLTVAFYFFVDRLMIFNFVQVSLSTTYISLFDFEQRMRSSFISIVNLNLIQFFVLI